MKRILLIALSLVVCTLNAQFGEHPADVDWKEMDSENVRVIFPDGLEAQASKIVNTVEHVVNNNTYSVGDKKRKLPIVLHTNDIQSNGSVQFLPYQSEFIGNYAQDFNLTGSTDWLSTLSIHEFRHSLQVNNAQRGLTRLAYLLQGERAWQILLYLGTPIWYLEGDAVVSETLLSKSGRGRTASFFAQQRAHMLGQDKYSFEKVKSGSFKDIVPNHYVMGYTMCNYTRNNYGLDVWKHVIKESGTYKWPVAFAFTSSLKRHTGKYSRQLYSEAYDALKKQWEEELKNIKLTPTNLLTTKSSVITDYEFPKVDDQGNIIAIKESYEKLPYICKISKDGKEKKIRNIGTQFLKFLSSNDSKIAWTEINLDIRYRHRTYSDICSYDLKTHKKKKLTKKGKYFCPEFNATGNKIIAVHTTNKLTRNLTILSDDGALIKTLPNPENYALSFPLWANNDESIVFIAQHNHKVALLKQNIESGELTALTEWSAHVIANPSINKGYAYFAAGYSGIDNIYAVSLSGDKKLKQITSVKFGAYQPEVKDGVVYFSEQTERGRMIAKLNLPNLKKLENFTYKEPIDMDRFKVKTIPQESNILDNDFVNVKQHKVRKYHSTLRDLKLHDWQLNPFSSSGIGINLKFTNYIRNLKSKLHTSYNFNENAFKYQGEITLAKWFPEFTLAAGKASRFAYYYSNTQKSKVDSYRFYEDYASASVLIPLQWAPGNYLTSLDFKSDFAWHGVKASNDSKAPTIKGDFLTLQSTLAFTNLRKKALKNLSPRFGQTLNLSYNVGLNKASVSSIVANGSIFLPGLSVNHGFEIRAGYKKELLTNPYQFIDAFEYSRGYNFTSNDEVMKMDINYRFPLFYPDWGFGNVVFFKRVHMNLFADLSKLKLDKKTTDQNSFGTELLFDNVYVNSFPMSAGARLSYLANTKSKILNDQLKLEFVFKGEF